MRHGLHLEGVHDRQVAPQMRMNSTADEQTFY